LLNSLFLVRLLRLPERFVLRSFSPQKCGNSSRPAAQNAFKDCEEPHTNPKDFRNLTGNFSQDLVILEPITSVMKSSLISADGFEPRYNTQLNTAMPSGGVIIESPTSRTPLEESSLAVPQHPLGIKPAGNKYTATSNAKDSVGLFQLFPDEIVAIFLEYLDATELRLLGSTCKYLYAFCRSDDIWKALFIE
jgi:hypothetical protein